MKVRNNREKMVQMKKIGFASVIAGSLMAAMIGLAGPASAGVVTDPATPHYSVDNHDDVNTTNGFVDVGI
jgi:hypothetical protein